MPTLITSSLTNYFHIIHKNISSSLAVEQFEESLHRHLTIVEECLDRKIPNFRAQTYLDSLTSDLKEHFAPLKQWNDYLDQNGHDDWYVQIAAYLIKVPFRATRNIICSLYDLITAIFYTAVHPLKSLNYHFHVLILCLYAATQPESWTKFGTAMIGANAGRMIIPGNLLSLISIAIGGALITAGVSSGALIAAFEHRDASPWEAATNNFCEQVASMPEIFTTSLLTTILIEKIHQYCNGSAFNRTHFDNLDEATKYADEFIKKHQLPPYSEISLDASGNLQLSWTGSTLDQFYTSHPDYFLPDQVGTPSHILIHLDPLSSELTIDVTNKFESPWLTYWAHGSHKLPIQV